MHVPGPSSARPPSHPTPEELQVSRRDASNFKLNRKATRDVTPGRPLAKCPPKTILGAKRRRRPATFFCTVPGCSSDFTTKHRLESKFPPFLSLTLLSSTLFPKIANPPIGRPSKRSPFGNQGSFCRRCSYKTAYHSDLVRHIKLNHKRHATKGLTQLDDQR